MKLEPGYLTDQELTWLVRESQLPKYMHDTEQARAALKSFAQALRRWDAVHAGQLSGDDDGA